MSFTSDELNYLVYRYLQESGFPHAAFTLFHETRIAGQPMWTGHKVPPGLLRLMVQKGLQFLHWEQHITEDGQEVPCTKPFTLLEPHFCDIDPSLMPVPTRALSTSSDGETAPMKRDLKAALFDDSVMDIDEVRAIPTGRVASKSKSGSSQKTGTARKERKTVGEPKKRRGRRSPVEEMVTSQRSPEAIEGDDDDDIDDNDSGDVRGSLAPSPFVPDGSLDVDEELLRLEPDAFLLKEITSIGVDKSSKYEIFECLFNPSGTTIAFHALQQLYMWKVPDGRSSDKLSEIPVPISKDQNWGETGFSLSFIDWKPVGDGHLTAALVVPKSPPPKNNQETTWVSNIINYDSCGGVLDTFTASHEQFVTAMKWSPRGMFLALGFQTGKVRVLDPKRQWEVMMDIQLPHAHPKEFAWRDDYTLAVRADESSVVVLKLSERIIYRNLIGHKTTVRAVQWNHFGRLASCSDDRTVIVWDVDAAEPLHTLLHEQSVDDISWCPVPFRRENNEDFYYLLSASEDGKARLWDTSSGECCFSISHNGPVSSVAFSPNGRYWVSASDDVTLNVCTTKNASLVKRFDGTLMGGNFTIQSVCWNRDGRRIAAVCGDNVVRIMDWNLP